MGPSENIHKYIFANVRFLLFEYKGPLICYWQSYWLLLTYSNKPGTLQTLKEKNERNKYLSVFNKEKIGVCNTAVTPYFEKGLIEPHILLKEIKNLLKTGLKLDSLVYVNELGE